MGSPKFVNLNFIALFSKADISLGDSFYRLFVEYNNNNSVLAPRTQPPVFVEITVVLSWSSSPSVTTSASLQDADSTTMDRITRTKRKSITWDVTTILVTVRTRRKQTNVRLSDKNDFHAIPSPGHPASAFSPFFGGRRVGSEWRWKE